MYLPGLQRLRSLLSRRRRRRSFVVPLALVSLTALQASCSSSPSFLRPSGPDAAWQRGLWWILFAISAVIFFEVVAIMAYGAWRRPRDAEVQQDHEFGTPLLWIGGIVIPLSILATVLGLSVAGMLTVSDPPPPAVTVEVIGHQWWWEVRYPHDNIVTANEIHIPVGQPAQILLTSADVIHDFWVPELNGKIDAIPGETNKITIQSSRAGTFRGECLVYCGLQHANMNFLVVAQPSTDYAAWVSQESTPPSPPTDPALLRGQQVFLGSSCSYCHTIAGTAANGTIGPDLTHLASRQQLAAGALPNTPGALGGWIIDSQTIKPGNKMPPENLSGPDLESLIAYLDSLK